MGTWRAKKAFVTDYEAILPLEYPSFTHGGVGDVLKSLCWQNWVKVMVTPSLVMELELVNMLLGDKVKSTAGR